MNLSIIKPKTISKFILLLGVLVVFAKDYLFYVVLIVLAYLVFMSGIDFGVVWERLDLPELWRKLNGE